MRVCVANTCAKIQEVWRFVNSNYIKSGYVSGDSDLEISYYPHLDFIDATTVFFMEDEGNIIGTISVTEDNPKGLNSDDIFPVETEFIRKRYKRKSIKLGSCWRMVVKEGNKISKVVLFKLIDAAITELIRRNLEVTLYCFHPKHEKIHKKLLGFSKISSKTHYNLFNNMPVILMRGDLTTMTRYWSKQYAK